MTYFDKAVLPWCGKFDRKKKGDLLVLVGSDFHAQYTDRFAWSVFLDTAKRMQPDVIALNGDVVDFYDLSRYSKDPTKPKDVQAEVNFTTRQIFAPLREACPNAQIDFIEGNHEWRLVKYLSEQAPGLAGLECLEFGSLFKLDDHEVNLVARRAFRRTQVKSRVRYENFAMYGPLLVTHGTATGQNPAAAELRRWKHTGVSGHLHRPFQVSDGNGLTGTLTWTVTGCMASTKLSHQYMEAPAGWVNGFAYAEVAKTTAQVTPVNFSGSWVSVAGQRYQAKKRG